MVLIKNLARLFIIGAITAATDAFPFVPRSYNSTIRPIARSTETESANGTWDGCLFQVEGVGAFTSQFSFDFTTMDELPDELIASTYTVGSGPYAPYAHTFFPENIILGSGEPMQMIVPGGQTSDPLSTCQVVTAFDDVLYASVRTVAQVSPVNGTVHGFFMYMNDTQETDIEIRTGDPTHVHYTNQQTHPGNGESTYAGDAPSDMSSAFHEYRYDWLPTETNYYIDGELQQTIIKNVPSDAGWLMWNNWANGYAWTFGPPLQDNILLIKSISALFNRTSIDTTCTSSTSTSAATSSKTSSTSTRKVSVTNTTRTSSTSSQKASSNSTTRTSSSSTHKASSNSTPKTSSATKTSSTSTQKTSSTSVIKTSSTSTTKTSSTSTTKTSSTSTLATSSTRTLATSSTSTPATSSTNTPATSSTNTPATSSTNTPATNTPTTSSTSTPTTFSTSTSTTSTSSSGAAASSTVSATQNIISTTLDTASASSTSSAVSNNSTGSVSSTSYSDGSTPTVAGVTFLIQANTSYSGELMNSTRKRESNASQSSCLSNCAANSYCAGTAYDSNTNMCYYYSSIDTDSQSTDSGTTFATVQSRAASSSSSSSSIAASTPSSTTSAASTPTVTVTCPDSNNTIYTDPSSGLDFRIECGIDHAGGDLSMVYVSDFAGCISSCADTDGCVDVSLSGYACYMKQSVGNVVDSSGIQGAKLIISAATSTSSSTSSTSSTTSTSSTSKSTKTASTTSTSAQTSRTSVAELIALHIKAHTVVILAS